MTNRKKKNMTAKKMAAKKGRATTKKRRAKNIEIAKPEDGNDYDPWQTLIHEAKLQVLDEFRENVEFLKNEGFDEVEAKRQSFSTVLPKLTKELEDVYVSRLLWMSHIKTDPTHKKIMQTRDKLMDEDFLDRDEALYSAVEKRKFLFKNLLEERQHFSDNESETYE